MKWEKEIALNSEYDILVAGGGPSGCAAAIAAARLGAKTLLLEASGSLGGMGTIGLVPAWCPFSDKEKIIYKGIAEEVFDRAKQGVKHHKKEDTDWVGIDSEALKRVYDEMVIEAGCDVLFQSSLCDAKRIANKIEYIVVSNKAGLTAYTGKVYIDCTGDADLVAWSGLEFEYGGSQGEVQPATHCFQLSNVDTYSYLNGPVLHSNNKKSPIYDILEDDKYDLIIDSHMCNNLVGPNSVGFNAGHIENVNPTDPTSVSGALIRGRKLANQFHDSLKEYCSTAFASSFLSATAPVMGIRESRRIVGEYRLTIDDYIARHSFQDEIGRCCYYADVHQSLPQSKDSDNAGTNKFLQLGRYNRGESYGIPFRSLIPKGIDNLLVAGKIISCDRGVLGSVRVMPPALVTGQAAGTAAAMASMNDYGIHKVPVDELQAVLEKNNVNLHGL